MMMWRPRLPSPFGTTFLGAPTALQLILHDLGFAPMQSDGEILVACCLEWVTKDKVANPDAVVFDPRPWTRIVGLAPDGNHVLVASDTYNLILARILGSQPQPLEEADLELATKTLQQLLFRAAGARQSHTYSPLEMEQAIRDREEWILSGSIEAPDVLAVANKWRHWKPGKIKTQLPTSQRALEQHLRARWLERLLGYFIPFRHQIPWGPGSWRSLATSLVMPCLAYRACARSAYRTSRPAPHEPGGHVGGHPGEAPEVVGHFRVALH